MAHLDITHWQMRLCMLLLLVGVEQELAAVSKAVCFHQASFSKTHAYVGCQAILHVIFFTGADILQLEMADAHCLAADRSSEPNGYEAMGPSA